MKKFYQRAMVAVGSLMVGASAFAQEGSESFDPSDFISNATETVTTVVGAIGALLAAALGLYLAFVGYRKAKEALNKA